MSGGADAAAPDGPTRLFVYNGGFLTDPHIRRILALSGYDIRLGKPGPGDMVGVWGKSPTSPRGEAVADWTDTPVLRVEDAFLRSILPGRAGGGPPLGLLIDRQGVHFDAGTPSDLETLLLNDPLDDSSVLARARDGIDRMKTLHLSKYSHWDTALHPPEAGYVLVVDQTRGDASVDQSGGGEATFREMLVFAQEEHPGARIVIRAHPETALGKRPGHYTEGHTHGHITFLTDPVSPWALLEGAIGVYTVSSQLGFEAILAGHRPRVFGQPFYAGWGLTADEAPVARRSRRLTRAQLFAAAMILAPKWYDPFRDRLCSFEDALDMLEARVRAFRQDRQGYVATGMRLWKRPHLRRAFGQECDIRFIDNPARAAGKARSTGRALLVWAGQEADTVGIAGEGLTVRRVEDGFLRSRGLGANLVPPLSLVADGSGIYYDPARISDLERLLASPCPAGGEARAERLIQRLTRTGLSKYNLDHDALPELPPGHRILVPGQVEDDASVRLGAGKERTNLDLLARTRAENPNALILYKPHPDVEAGLRIGALEREFALRHADMVLTNTDPVQAIEACDEVWTITSTLGFEALLRGKPVTCLGMPFYAGWGLTRDRFPAPARRRARPSRAAFVHAALIAYPRYIDPVTGRICPPEVVLDRIARREIPNPGSGNRMLSKLQGLMASHSWLWRRRAP